MILVVVRIVRNIERQRYNHGALKCLIKTYFANEFDFSTLFI